MHNWPDRLSSMSLLFDLMMTSLEQGRDNEQKQTGKKALWLVLLSGDGIAPPPWPPSLLVITTTLTHTPHSHKSRKKIVRSFIQSATDGAMALSAPSPLQDNLVLLVIITASEPKVWQDDDYNHDDDFSSVHDCQVRNTFRKSRLEFNIFQSNKKTFSFQTRVCVYGNKSSHLIFELIPSGVFLFELSENFSRLKTKFFGFFLRFFAPRVSVPSLAAFCLRLITFQTGSFFNFIAGIPKYSANF